VKLLPGFITRLTRTPDRLSQSMTASSPDEFAWPPKTPVEAYDFNTGQMVSLSPSWERDPVPRATAHARRDVVLWRPGKWVRPIVATLAILAIVEVGYLSVRFFLRERQSSGEASSTQTSRPAVAERSAVTVPSSPNVASGPAIARGKNGLPAGKARDHGRTPSAQSATTPQGAAVATPGTLGWFSLSLPIQAQIFENAHFVGTSDGRRVMLPAGRHELELVNESLRYREWRSVEIQSGRATSLAVVLPAGRLQVNAIPWSEVLIDGKRVGETPLGDLRLPIGAHRIVFRHPQLGELTRTATIVAGVSTRISVNFNQ
jgi:PEGA domain